MVEMTCELRCQVCPPIEKESRPHSSNCNGWYCPNLSVGLTETPGFTPGGRSGAPPARTWTNSLAVTAGKNTLAPTPVGSEFCKSLPPTTDRAGSQR